MKLKKFDVVELKNDNKGTTVDTKNITQEDIKKIIYTRQKKFRL